MRTMRIADWARLYRKELRPRIAHLPKREREKLVRACKGKAIYDTWIEALAVIERLPLIDDKMLGAYECWLCGSIHTGNRKYLTWPKHHVFKVEGREPARREGGLPV